MKYKLTKKEFEALGDDTKKEYTLDGESALLKIEGEGAPSAAEITRLNDKLRIEKDHKVKAEKALITAEKAAEKLREDLGKASGKEEIAKINEKHQAELEKIRSERETEQKEATAKRHAEMKAIAAAEFAEKHFTIPGLMKGEYAKRLSVEVVGGEEVIRVLDADGKPTALSVSELQKEYLDNKEFESIIKADVGQGGGAANSNGGGGASSKKLSEMTATEEAQFEKEHPDEYAEALADLG